MKLSEAQLKQMLDEATQTAKELIKKDLVNKIEYEMTDTARNMIKHHVQEWVQKEVLPEVTVRLVASKDGLVSAALPMADMITEGITKGLTKAVEENMSKSYTRKKIFESLFD